MTEAGKIQGEGNDVFELGIPSQSYPRDRTTGISLAENYEMETRCKGNQSERHAEKFVKVFTTYDLGKRNLLHR